MKNDYYSLLQTVYSIGNHTRPRGHLTKELTGQKLVIDDYNLFASPIHRPIEDIMQYLMAETAWYMSGELNPSNIVRNAKMWGEITNEFGNINSNYGHRVFYRKNKNWLSGFEFALNCLQADKETRNAIIIYNEPDLCYNGNKDFICSQNQHFLIRNDELNCFIHLRSSDLIFGVYFNSPWWSLVHQQMFLSLKNLYRDLTLGKIEVFISSAHIYERHFGLVEKILESPKERYFMRWNNLIPLNKSFEFYKENIRSYFSTCPAINEKLK